LTQKHPTLGVAFALIAAILFGLNASATKVIIQSGLSTEQVVIVRSFCAFLIALIWAITANRSSFRFPLKLLPVIILMGVVGSGMLQWTYSIAVVRLPIGIALLIEYTAVLWVPLIALVFFKEKVKRQIWFGAVLVLGGLAVVGEVWASTLDPIGVLFAFGAAISLTTYFITGERVQRTLPTNVTMVYAMGISTMIFLPFAGLSDFDIGRLQEPQNLMGNLSGFDAPLWLALLWLGVMGGFMPMMFSFLALRHLSATIVGVIATSETVLAFLFALLWLNELISLTQALGGMLVVAGILLAQTARKQTYEKVVE
jgi:drug/metabolite transporter (DMT)-like permease